MELATPVDARLSSPTATWALFLKSLREGNRDDAVTCLTSRARRNFRPIFEKASRADFIKYADFDEALSGFDPPETPTELGEFQWAFARTKDGNGGDVTFWKNYRGEWKISEM